MKDVKIIQLKVPSGVKSISIPVKQKGKLTRNHAKSLETIRLNVET
jgi:hypothetical protein